MHRVPDYGGIHFLPNTGVPALSLGSCAPPCGPFSCPGLAHAHRPPQLQAAAGRERFPGFEWRAFVEEGTHQCGALPGGREQPPLPPLSHEVVDHHQQSTLWSIWWEEDATCIGISEELFEVFGTDCMKSFTHQLSLYGFSKVCQGLLTSLCLTNLLTEEPPCLLSKLKAGEYLLGPGGRVGANLRAARDGGRSAGKAMCKDRTGDQHMVPGWKQVGRGVCVPL